MSQYKISVILAVYNVEKYIEESFESLKRQTIGFHNLEVIFVDDASLDNSGKMINEYAAQYENVMAIHLKENSGYCGRPRNIGIEASTAKYIMFLDPDDLYEERACEVLYEAAQKTGCDIVSGYFSVIDSEGNTTNAMANPYPDFDEFAIKKIDDMPDVFQMRVAFWAKIYTRNMLVENGIRFQENIPAQDAIASVECMLAAHGITYIKEPIVKYRIRNAKDKSVTFDISKKNIMGIASAFRTIYGLLEHHHRTDYFHIMIRDFAAYYINALIDSSLSPEDLLLCFQSLQFVLARSVEKSLFSGSESVQTIAGEIAAHHYKTAVLLSQALRPYRSYQKALEEGKAWIEHRLENKQVECTGLKAKLEDKQAECAGLKAKLEDKQAELENLQKNIQASILCRLVRKIYKW